MGSDTTPFERKQEVLDLWKQREAIDALCEPSQFRVLTRIVENPANHVVVSFGGGAVPGIGGNLALARMLDELDLRKHVNEVWGCSAGAVVAGPWATGMPVPEITDIIKSTEKHGPVRVRYGVLIKGIFDRVVRKRPLPDGVMSADATKAAILRGLRSSGRMLIEESPIPLRLVAVSDDGYARRVVFREGPVAESIMASMCIPGVMEPIHSWNGDPHGYLDGGIVEKTPLTAIIDDHQRTIGDGQLVVICSHFTDAGRLTVPRGFLARLLHTFDRLEDRIWDTQLDQARRLPHVKCIVVSPNIPGGGMFDISRMDFNLLWSRREFKQQLSNAGMAARFEGR